MSSEEQDLGELSDLAREVATRAGELVRIGRAEAIGDIGTKSSVSDVVTAMDTACERFLIETLAERRPGDAVYGEEHGRHAGSTGVRWIVDPIDGTVNYLYGLGDYAVSVAVEVDGVVVAGAVSRPSSGELFHARRGHGAYLDDRRLHTSAPTGLDVTLVGTGFGYDATRRTQQGTVVLGLLHRIRDIRRMGSAALDICYVADGRLDAFYEWGLHLWDYAAAALIAAEAGVDVRRPTTEEGLFYVAAPTISAALLAELESVIDPQWNVAR